MPSPNKNSLPAVPHAQTISKLGAIMNKFASFLTSGLVVAVLGVPALSPSARAQDRPQEQDRAQSQDRNQARFQEKDRQSAKDWYEHHRSNAPEGFRSSDRLSSDMESHLRVGVVVDNDLRHRVHPVPPDLLATLTPPPPGYRYVVIGGQICLVDDGWRIHDIINITL
jgi:Ni/Co efflux regulator RcnB